MALARAQRGLEDGFVTSALSDALRGTWFAAELPPRAREALLDIAEPRRYATGETAIVEGIPCRSLGVVVEGRLSLRLRLPGGESRAILTVEPGDLFGWSALLPASLGTSTAVAVQPTFAILFDGLRLLAALERDADLAAAVYQRVLVALARRLGATRTQLLDLYAASYDPW
jgi:CRP-like cAMP-binding protein